MASLTHIGVYPVKALDPAERRQIAISDIGGLRHDRTYAIIDSQGQYINGKRTDAVHRLRTGFDLDADTVTVRTPGSEPLQFHLERDRDELEAWLSAYFGTPVSLQTAAGGGLTDGVVYGEATDTGPTLVSTATLRVVASWFEGIEPEEMRLRLRPNLVVDDVPAFWEDRLIAGDGQTVRVGDVRLVGTKPISRCVVPTRHPHTGEPYPDFQRIFVDRREQSLPHWAPREQFDHYFKLMVGLRIPTEERRGELRVGDAVELVPS